MKIPQTVLASLLGKMGRKIKAELVIDDSTGVPRTFPEISDVSEIAEGVAVDAPDGTYVFANGDEALTVVVAAGVVTSVTVDSPEAEASVEDAEVLQVLEAVVDENVALKEEVKANKEAIANLTTALNDLKVSLKHDDGKGAAPAAAGNKKSLFKAV